MNNPNPQNKYLKEFPDGFPITYNITIQYGSDWDYSERSGFGYYPFAIRQDKQAWVLDHLPTGFLLSAFRTKQDALDMVNRLFANFNRDDLENMTKDNFDLVNQVEELINFKPV